LQLLSPGINSEGETDWALPAMSQDINLTGLT
jgi:hypothetical protein